MYNMRCVVFLYASFLCTVLSQEQHPLDEYISRPDDTYTYSQIAVYEEDGYDVHVVNMTSQTWMSDSFSDRSVWWHYVVIVLPSTQMIPDQATILVGIGNMDDPPPDPETDPFIPLLGELAVQTGSVTAMITNVPQQPCVFAEDPSQMSRTEDAIIAWTWARFMNDTENRETEPLLFFPMTKAVVRALDTVTSYSTEQDPFWDIDKFIVTGPSKRGWTTWLTGAVDDRVVGLAPMVLSLLNMIPNMHHHYQSLGGWTWAFGDYWREGLMERLDSEDALLLVQMQDPFVFRERLTMPKLYIKASNDEFLMFDDMDFWFYDLPGENNIWVLENSIHIMAGHYARLVDNIATFFLHVYYDVEFPAMTYELESSETDASTIVRCNQEPVNVTVWYANTNNDEDRRDWRWLILGDNGTEIQPGVRWYDDVGVEDLGNNDFRIQFDAPEEGWLGFFITVVFDSPVRDRFIEFSSEPNVVPNTFGYEDCRGAECKGILK